jgi:magnesium-transporting ATPase (P-type)
MYNEMRNLTLIGLVGIRDPPRPDVPTAIDVIRRAGVRVFMVTGDFKLTAVAIARQVRASSYVYLRFHVYVVTPRSGSSRNTTSTQSTMSGQLRRKSMQKMFASPPLNHPRMILFGLLS